jgi:hypothetical protein
MADSESTLRNRQLARLSLARSLDSWRSLPLFAAVPPLFLVNMAGITGDDFRLLVTEFGLRWIIDLRPVPSFNIGHLHRRAALMLFARYKIDYRDLPGTQGTPWWSGTAGLPDRVVSEVAKVFDGEREGGPVAILLDDSRQVRRWVHVLANGECHQFDGWKIEVVDSAWHKHIQNDSR